MMPERVMVYSELVGHPACAGCGAADALLYEGLCFSCLEAPITEGSEALLVLEGIRLDCPICRKVAGL